MNLPATERTKKSQPGAPLTRASSLPGRPASAVPAKPGFGGTGNLVPYLHYGAERLGRTGIGGLALAAFALIFFVSTNLPLHEQLAEQNAALEAARLDGRDSLTPGADARPENRAVRFVESLPGRDDVPAIMASVVAVAAASGIELKEGSYEYLAADDESIGHYEMTLPVTGSYPQIRAFVENVLATEPSVSLDSMRLERGSVTDTIVAADLQFSILLGEAL